MAASFKERVAWAMALVGSLATHAIGGDKVLVELEARPTSMTQPQVVALQAWAEQLWPDKFDSVTELFCSMDWRTKKGRCQGYGVRPYDKDRVPSEGLVLPE